MQDTIEREEKIPIDQVTNLEEVDAYQISTNFFNFGYVSCSNFELENAVLSYYFYSAFCDFDICRFVQN